jgi:hypothetical protein
MDQLKAPEKLNFDAPDSHTWKKWKEEFSLYADLAMEDKDEKTRCLQLTMCLLLLNHTESDIHKIQNAEL